MIALKVVLNSERKKKIDKQGVGVYKRAFLYYKKHGFKKFYQRLLEEPKNLLRRSLYCYCQRFILVEKNPQEALPPMLPPLIPTRVSVLNEDILDKSNISLLGNKEIVLKNLGKGGKFFIALHKNTIISYVNLSFQEINIPWHPGKLKLNDKEAHWAYMGTLSGYKGKGIIPQVVCGALDFLKQAGYQRVVGIIGFENKPSLRTAKRFKWSVSREIISLTLPSIKITLSINPNLYFWRR